MIIGGQSNKARTRKRNGCTWYLIRHGNAKKLAGESYVTAPLTELGRKQAEC